jgi:hypothetical protein
VSSSGSTTTFAAASPIGTFREMEARLEKEPDTVQGKITLGTYLMSPRPRTRHRAAQANRVGEL